jgi:hypothetical protein
MDSMLELALPVLPVLLVSLVQLVMSANRVMPEVKVLQEFKDRPELLVTQVPLASKALLVSQALKDLKVRKVRKETLVSLDLRALRDRQETPDCVETQAQLVSRDHLVYRGHQDLWDSLDNQVLRDHRAPLASLVLKDSRETLGHKEQLVFKVLRDQSDLLVCLARMVKLVTLESLAILDTLVPVDGLDLRVPKDH